MRQTYRFVAAWIGCLLVVGLLLASTSAHARKSSQHTRNIVIVNLNLSEKDSPSCKRIRKRLERADKRIEVRILHHRKFTRRWIQEHAVHGVVLSPQGDPWWFYEATELERLKKVVRSLEVPVLGICGGHQFLAMAHGVEVKPIKGPQGPKGYEGLEREKGYIEIQFVANSRLCDWIKKGETAAFWENHAEEVKALPDGFVLIAAGGKSPIQMMESKNGWKLGTQFHPEKWTDEHPLGRKVMRCFVAAVVD